MDRRIACRVLEPQLNHRWFTGFERSLLVRSEDRQSLRYHEAATGSVVDGMKPNVEGGPASDVLDSGKGEDIVGTLTLAPEIPRPSQQHKLGAYRFEQVTSVNPHDQERGECGEGGS